MGDAWFPGDSFVEDWDYIEVSLSGDLLRLDGNGASFPSILPWSTAPAATWNGSSAGNLSSYFSSDNVVYKTLFQGRSVACVLRIAVRCMGIDQKVELYKARSSTYMPEGDGSSSPTSTFSRGTPRDQLNCQTLSRFD